MKEATVKPLAFKYFENFEMEHGDLDFMGGGIIMNDYGIPDDKKQEIWQIYNDNYRCIETSEVVARRRRVHKKENEDVIHETEKRYKNRTLKKICLLFDKKIKISSLYE